jgi:regulatory protein
VVSSPEREPAARRGRSARTALSLKGQALRLLGMREHSRAELERKLAGQEQNCGELARVLDELQAKGFIDEGRVVESWIHRRAPAFGSVRIRQDLLQKGIAADVVQATVRELQGTEVERARALWLKRFSAPVAGEPVDPREQLRQGRYLMARGFAADVVRKVLRESGRGDPDAVDESAPAD